MRMKSLAYLIVFAAAAYFCWQQFQPTPELTPEQQIEAIAHSGHTSSTQLSALAKSHPTLLTKALRGRRLSVSGVLQKALVRGVASDELSLDLAGVPGKKIFFASHHQRLANKGNYRPSHKFEKVGGTIYMIVEAKKERAAGGGGGAGVAQTVTGKLASLTGGTKPRTASSLPEIEKTPLFAEGAQTTLEGTFRYINAASVMLEWHPPGA
jgi:hypothetical protein